MQCLTAAPAYPDPTLQVLLATLEREWLLMKRNRSAHARRSALHGRCQSDVPHVIVQPKERLGHRAKTVSLCLA